MKNIFFESILVTASVALWLVVLPLAAIILPFLSLLHPGGGPRPQPGRRGARPRLLPVPA